MADLQILPRTGAHPTVTLYLDVVPADSSTQVKVDVVRPDGTLLVTQADASDETGTGVYGYQLAPQTELTDLRLDWSGTIGGVATTASTRVEVVGAHLFNVSELRGFKVAGGTPFATDAVPLFTTQQLMDARAATLDELRTILGFHPVPRFRRKVLSVRDHGQTCLNLPDLFAHRLISLTINGVAQDLDGYQVTEIGQLESISNYGPGAAFTVGRRNVAVEYAAGWERVEGFAGHAAMLMAAKHLNPSAFVGATTVSTPDGAVYSYEPSEMGRSGFQRYTGVRDLDRWLHLHTQSGFAVA